jgi:hypothetical protein
VSARRQVVGIKEEYVCGTSEKFIPEADALPLPLWESLRASAETLDER